MWRWVFVLAGCGRLAFDPKPIGDGGAADAGDSATDATQDVAGGCGFVELAPAGNHVCARRADGTGFCWGDNTWGELGDTTYTPHYVPQPIAETGFTSLARGDQNTTCGLKADGTVWCWGRSDSSVLGVGGRSAVPQPIQLGGADFDRVIEVEVGEHHACARRDDRTVWCWGWNQYGQAGPTAGADVPQPIQVAGLLADELAIGYATNCARIGDRVQCWGWGEWGQLGDGTNTVSRPAPGEVLDAGVALEGVTSIAAGYLQVCARDGGAGAVCWGTGREVGNPSNGGATSPGAVLVYEMTSGLPLTAVSSVGAGDRFSCARQADATVRCWGDNDEGQLGDGTFTDRVPAMPVLTGPGTPLGGVLKLAVGNEFSCALRTGDVMCWGSNESGQMGVGTTSITGQVYAAPITCP